MHTNWWLNTSTIHKTNSLQKLWILTALNCRAGCLGHTNTHGYTWQLCRQMQQCCAWRMTTQCKPILVVMANDARPPTWHHCLLASIKLYHLTGECVCVNLSRVISQGKEARSQTSYLLLSYVKFLVHTEHAITWPLYKYQYVTVFVECQQA